MNSRSNSRLDFAQVVTSPGWSRCEDLIEAFEAAWRSGPPPKIADYACSEGEIRAALLVELIHVDLEFRIKLGEAVRPENYFEAFPELADDERLPADLRAAVQELRARLAKSIDVPRREPHLTVEDKPRSK